MPSRLAATVSIFSFLVSSIALSLHSIGEPRIKRGECNATMQTLKILADTLECRMVDLVKGP